MLILPPLPNISSPSEPSPRPRTRRSIPFLLHHNTVPMYTAGQPVAREVTPLGRLASPRKPHQFRAHGPSQVPHSLHAYIHTTLHPPLPTLLPTRTYTRPFPTRQVSRPPHLISLALRARNSKQRSRNHESLASASAPRIHALVEPTLPIKRTNGDMNRGTHAAHPFFFFCFFFLFPCPYRCIGDRVGVELRVAV